MGKVEKRFDQILMNKSEIIIFRSNEDDAYMADIPELPGCMAHCDTYKSALETAKEVIQHWIETAKEFGNTIPKLKGQRLVYD